MVWHSEACGRLTKADRIVPRTVGESYARLCLIEATAPSHLLGASLRVEGRQQKMGRKNVATRKLSDFIRANINPILVEWEQFAQDIPSARHLKESALRDHASGMLNAIAADLDLVQTSLEQAEKSKGRAPRNLLQTQAELHGAA